MKKVIIVIIVMICIFAVACEEPKKYEDSNIFDMKAATDVGNEFMKNLSGGDVEAAKKLLKDKEITDSEKNAYLSNIITSYKVNKTIEGANYAYIKYLVIREEDSRVTVDLDNLNLKVVNHEGNYVIDDVLMKGIKHVYRDGNVLRIRDEEEGTSELLLRLIDLPKEVFPKNSQVVLNKETVPDMSFSKLGIGFGGDMVATILTGDNKSIITLASINKAAATVSQNEESSSAKDVENAIDKSLEKPIAQDLVGYDILDDSEVRKIFFSNDDSNLILQVYKDDFGERVRVYKNPNGELVDLKLEEMFPSNEYSLNIIRVVDEGIFVEVKLLENEEYQGMYKLDLKRKEVDKV